MKLCDDCGHSIHRHGGPDGCTKVKMSHDGSRYECTCPTSFGEIANPGRVRIVDCKATYSEPDGAFLRCDGRHNEAGHHGQDSPFGAGRVNWTESVAVYPFNEGPVGNGSTRDAQVGGEHYRKFKIQPWDVIDEYGLSFYAGNALKYLLRAGNKGSKVEDLKKCRHYLDKLIEIEEGEDGA